MTHKKKYKSGDMPFSVYSSSVDTGYAFGMSEQFGKLSDPSSSPYGTIYFGQAPFSLDTDGHEIGTASLDPFAPSSIGTIIQSGNLSTNFGFFGVSVDNINNKLYYSSLDTGSPLSTIYSSNLDGTSAASIFTPALVIEGMKVAPSQDKIIYGADDTDSKLFTSSLDGTNSGEVIMAAGAYMEKGGFAYSATTNKIYFRYYNDGSGFTGRIYTCNLDGTDNGYLGILDGVNAHCFGMDVDEVNQKLYWTIDDSSTARIFTCSLDGTDSGEIYQNASIDDIRGIAVDPYAEKVYFSDLDPTNSRIYSCDLYGQNGAEMFDPGFTKPYALSLAFASPTLLPSGIDITNLHEDTYGGIKDAPMQGPFTYQYVGGNQHRHVPLNKGSDRWYNRPELFNINLSSSGEITVTNPANSYLTPRESEVKLIGEEFGPGGDAYTYDAGWGVAIDRENELLFFQNKTSGGESQIFSASLAGSTADVSPSAGLILDDGTGTGRDIAVDPSAQKIYWTDSGGSKSFVSRMDYDGTNIERLIADFGSMPVDNPGGIALDIAAGMMYYTDWKDNEEAIYRAPMDGTGSTLPEMLIHSSSEFPMEFPMGIALDIPNGMMYWADGMDSNPDNEDAIWRAPMNGTSSQAPERVLLLGSEGGLPELTLRYLKLDLTNRKMYWSNTTTDRIMRANMDGTFPETVIDRDLGSFNIYGIDIDVEKGKLYFANQTQLGIWECNMSPYFPAKPVPYTRGLVAKRPVNIANHKTYNPIGNFTYDYEVIQTTGRTSNNRAFVEACTGSYAPGFIGDPNLPYSGTMITHFVSGARDPLTGTALPVFPPQETVFVNRFNAPGGPDVSSRGVLDTYAEEFAPNNDINIRNHAVRSMLRSDLARPSPAGTAVSGATKCVVPTQYHTDNRNTRYYKQSPIFLPKRATRIYTTYFGENVCTEDDQVTYHDIHKDNHSYGSQVNIPIMPPNKGPYGICVDHINRKVYATSHSDLKIYSSNLEGGDSTEVVDVGALPGFTSPEVNSIAVHPTANRIVFPVIELNTSPDTFYMYTASLDGSDVGEIHDFSTLSSSYECNVNVINNKVYMGVMRSGADDEVFTSSLDGTNFGPLEDLNAAMASTGNGTMGIDFDYLAGKLYVCGEFHPGSTDVMHVWRSNFDGTDPELIMTDEIDEDITNPRDINVDPYSRRIYITIKNYEPTGKPYGVYTCSLDNPGTGSENLWGMAFAPDPAGDVCEYYRSSLYFPYGNTIPEKGEPTQTLVQNPLTVQGSYASLQNMVYPKGLALDATKGLMFWTDTICTDAIFSAPMNQCDRPNLVIEDGTVPVNDPRKLALDTCNEKIYWTEASHDTLNSCSYDGTNAGLVRDTASEPEGICVDTANGKIYYVCKVCGELFKMNLDGSVEVKVMDLQTDRYGVRGIDVDLTEQYVWMACAGALDDDLDLHGIYRYPTHASGNMFLEKMWSGPQTISASEIAVDYDLGKIYWTTVSSRDPAGSDIMPSIYRANRNGTNMERLFVVPGTGSHGIALDLDAGQMYWTNLPVIGDIIDQPGGTILCTDIDEYISGSAVNRANMPEKPVYDNGFITHAIPQCTLQYSWIKASAITDRSQLLGYQSDSYTGSSTGY